jgi:ribosomal protein S12 methylthiotransferase accessory factor
MEAQASRRVDASTVDEEVCFELLERYRRAGVDVGIWDVTSDVGVPSFLCIVVDRKHDPFRPMGAARGSGSHPDRAVALARALTEAAQSRLTRIAGSRDDLRPDHLAAERAEQSASLARGQLESPVAPARNYQRISTQRHDSLDEDLHWLQTRLAASGMPQVVGVDLSKPKLPCSVMRVLVAGLEGVSEAPGYRPGKRVLGRRAASL